MGFQPLGKMIIAKKNPPKKGIDDKLFLPDDVKEEIDRKDVAKYGTYHFTVSVVATGPEVRPEIKKGTRIVIASGRWPHIDVIFIDEVEYLVIPDSESYVPVIMD